MKCDWHLCQNQVRQNTRGTKAKFCSPACNSKSKVVRWRKNIKLRAIEYKGGKCVFCGYNRCPNSLDFHHIDPSQKEFGISAKGTTRSWERVKIELDKCVLLCRNCHGEHHAGLINLAQAVGLEPTTDFSHG